MREGDPIWAWGGAWKPARVIVPALGLNSRRALVGFDCGVMTPLGRSKIRPRDLRLAGADKPFSRARGAERLLRRMATAAAWINFTAWTLRLMRAAGPRGWSRSRV